MNYIWNNDTLSLHDGDTLVAEIGFQLSMMATYVVERTWVMMLTEVKELQVKLPLHLLQESRR